MSDEENAELFPESGITSLVSMALSMHELFKSFVAAGFSERHAIYLVGVILTKSQNDGCSGVD